MHSRIDPTPNAKSPIYRSGNLVIDLRRSNSILTGRATAQAVQIADGLRFASLEEALAQMRTSNLDAATTEHFIEVLTGRADSLLSQAADNLASEALALGRHDEMTVFAQEIEVATYTSLLDENTCDACAAADGTEVVFGSAEYNALLPPYVDCEGRGRCRCQFVLTLKTEAPPGAIPLRPLSPRPPWRPLPSRGTPVPWERPIVSPPAPIVPLPAPTVSPKPEFVPPPVKSLPATGTPKEYAVAVRERAAASEPAISRAVAQAADDANGTLGGFEFRLKTVASIERKIAADVHLLVAPAVQDSIKDAIRYTTLFRAEQYAAGTKTVIARLRAQGFTLVRVKNAWQAEATGYQGINTVWRAQNGQLFEMQFHTPFSIDVKERISHPLYDLLKASTDPKERLAIERKIADAWKTVPRPNGVLDLDLAA
jgi:hypothetical protein